MKAWVEPGNEYTTVTIHAMKAWVEPRNEYITVTIHAMKAWVEPGNEFTIVTIHVMKARQSLTMKLVSVYRIHGLISVTRF